MPSADDVSVTAPLPVDDLVGLAWWGALLAVAVALVAAVGLVTRSTGSSWPPALRRVGLRGDDSLVWAVQSTGSDDCGHSGRKPCFECFWNAHAATFTCWAVRICTDYGVPDMAEDVLQEAATRLCLRWRRPPPLDHPKAYVYSTLRSQASDAYRERGIGCGRRRKQDVSLDTTEFPDTEQPDPESAALLAERRLTVITAIESLPPKQRDVIICRYILGRSPRETAELLGMDPHAERSTHYRALRSLRALLPRDLLDDRDGCPERRREEGESDD